jgi:hypothetical protein
VEDRSSHTGIALAFVFRLDAPVGAQATRHAGPLNKKDPSWTVARPRPN